MNGIDVPGDDSVARQCCLADDPQNEEPIHDYV